MALSATVGRVFGRGVVWELAAVARPGAVTHVGAALAQADRGWRLAGAATVVR